MVARKTEKQGVVQSQSGRHSTYSAIKKMRKHFFFTLITYYRVHNYKIDR